MFEETLQAFTCFIVTSLPMHQTISSWGCEPLHLPIYFDVNRLLFKPDFVSNDFYVAEVCIYQIDKYKC